MNPVHTITAEQNYEMPSILTVEETAAFTSCGMSTSLSDCEGVIRD